MVKKVDRNLIDLIAAELLKGRIAYMSIYAINNKKATKFNIDYELHKDDRVEEITERHIQAKDILYEFIEALESGNVNLFSLIKRGLNITHVTSFNEKSTKDKLVESLTEVGKIISNSNISSISISLDDKEVSVKDIIGSLIETIKNTKG